jgi:hypothetical protein
MDAYKALLITANGHFLQVAQKRRLSAKNIVFRVLTELRQHGIPYIPYAVRN